ncbi:MAG: Ohr family peroxiredoxin [Myxococcales bacterium]|nr:Ohr family peroxiredoxin [Myxococcales bacterium]
MSTMKVIYTGRVEVTGGRGGRATSDDGMLATKLAFPKPLGGDGEGSNPEQLFGAGYAACFASTIGAVARATGTKIGNVSVSAEVDMLHAGDARFDLAIRLVVRAADVSQSDLDTLVARARDACPYSSATRDAIATTVRAEVVR